MSPASDAAALVKKTRRWYVLWWAGMPTLVSGIVFASLCAYECSVMPWMTFIAAPLISVLLAVVAAIRYWRWAAALSAQDQRSVRWFIGSSALWGPCLGIAVFVGVLATAGVLVGLLGHGWR